MKTYRVRIRYSRDGKSWYQTTVTIKATSDSGAIMQAERKYPFVREVDIVSVKE